MPEETDKFMRVNSRIEKLHHEENSRPTLWTRLRGLFRKVVRRG